MFYQGNTTFTKRIFTFNISVLFILEPILAADIMLDSRGHKAGHTTLDTARNGVPVVNIARPNSSGVSHNTYINFNVPTQGTILNNSGKEINTKLSGYIYGNENVKERSATLILNEVSGTNPTHLNGYLEVAGPSADVIVANPNGVKVNGAGFINTPKATLTTGKVTMSGNRPGFDVSGGDVRIEGRGLDASKINLDIYAQSIKLNAELHAKKLKLVVGKNTIDATGKVTAKANNSGGYGLDSSTLGGIYANAITLTGTQKGVGVNLPGEMLLQDSLSITVDGKISLGQVLAKNDMGLESKSSDITIYKGAHAKNLTLDAKGTVRLDGDTSATNDADITASDLLNNSTLAAGVNADFTEAGQGVLTLKLAHSVINNAVIYAKDTITMNTGDLINRKDASISSEDLTINAVESLKNAGNINAGRTSLSTKVLSNTGLIHANGDLTVNAQKLDSSNAVIEGLAEVTLSVSGDLNVDRGTLYAQGETAIVAGNLSGTKGEILLQSTASIEVSETVDLNDGYIEAERLTLDAQAFNANNAQVLSLGELALTTQTIHADTSTIQAVGDISIYSEIGIQQNDHAVLYSEGNIDIETNTFGHTGGSELISLENTSIDTKTLDNTESSIMAKNLTVTAETVENSNAELLASESLELATDTLDNTDGVIQSNAYVDVEASDNVDNTRGLLYATEDIVVTASAFDNEDGLLGSNKTVSLKSTEFTGDRGTLSGEGISVETNTITSDRAAFESTDTLDITASGDVTLTNTSLLANNQLNLTAQDTILDGSTLFSAYEGIDLSTHKLQAKNAYLEADTMLKLNASKDVDISDSTLRARDVDLNTVGDITAEGTNIVAIDKLNVMGNNLTQSNGQFISDGNVYITLDGILNQENSSSIISYGSAVIKTNNYYTSGDSTFYSDKALIINVTDTFEHTDASRIITNDTAEITAKTLIQNNALIYAEDDASFETETYNTTDAKISATTTQIHTTNFNNKNGDFSLDSDSVDIVAADKISNTNGVMSVNGDLALIANKIVSDKGEFESGNTLKATSQTLQVIDSRFFGTEHLEIDSFIGQINEGTKLLSLNSMKLDFAGNVINHGEITANGMYGGENDINIRGSLTNYGNINSGYTLNVDAVNITNLGKIQGGGFSTVNLTGTLDNRGFFTSSYDLEINADMVNNFAGIASANDLTLRASNLSNTNVLYSGRDMNLYVSSKISNSKDIYAGRDLFIAGDESGTRAGLVENNRGNIESYRDLVIKANTFRNSGSASLGFERIWINDITGEMVTEEEMNAWIADRVEGGSWKNTHTSSVVNRLRNWFYDRDLYDIATEENGGIAPGKNSEIHTWREFHTETTGTASLTPAYVISGANTYIDAGTIENKDAVISSGGDMHFQADTVKNVPSSIEVENKEIFHTVGWEFEPRDFNHRPRTSVYETSYEEVVTGLSLIESTSQILVGGTFSGNIGNFQNGASSALQTSSPAVIDTGAKSTSDTQEAVVGVDNTVSQAYIDDRSQTVLNSIDDALMITKLDITPKIYDPNTVSIKLPNNPYGIFVTNTKPTGPLIELNPEYTNYNNYVSSDYLLDRLGYDGTEQTRRLGDAMYETQLVRNSIMAMTGQRYIGDATNDAELYINLLDGGVKFAKEVGLILGVAPTAKQLSHINEDLVWLVKRNVGGHTVLAPVVYLAHAYEGAKGGQIDANNINLDISGHLGNAGNINTRSDMTLKVNTLTNASGNINAGKNMNITAIGDIKNLSGSIKGGSVVLRSSKGNIINETLTGSIDLYNNFGKRHHTVVGKTASIETKNGPLVLDAGKNIENIGADLRSSGSIGLSAGENVEVSTIKNESSYAYTMPQGTSSGESVTHIQSNIEAGDGFSILSGKDTNLEAVNIKASNTNISAQGTVNLNAVVDSELKESYEKKEGLLSSSSIRDMTLQQFVKGTKLETDILVIMGKEGVELESATVTAANTAHFRSSEGDVTLSAKNYTNASLHEETNSILGGLYESRELDAMSETLLANSSTSALNSINVGAKNVNIIATDISANGEVMLSATENVNIMSDLEERSETHVDEKSGISLGYNDGRFTFYEKNYDSLASTSSVNKASNIQANTLMLKSGEDTNIIASNVTAGTMIVNTDRDFNVLSARDITTMHTEHATEETGIEFTLNSREASVFAGYWEEKNGEHTSKSEVASSNISVGSLGVNAGNTNIVGSNIVGDDIVIHSGNIRILSDSTETNTDAYTHYLRTGVEVGVKQNLSSVFDTAYGLKDVKSGTAALAGALQTYDAVQGFAEKPVTAGVYALHDESYSNTHLKNADVVASNISATNSLILNAKNELEIAGSDVASANTLNIFADTINIHASQSTYSTKTGIETKHASIGMSDGSWLKTTVAYQENEMSTNGTVQRNSQIYAGGTANITSRGDTMLKGANIDAKDLHLNVGGDLHIESLQDTQTIAGSSRGGSVSGGLGGISGVSMNAGKTSGERAWVSQVTSINGRESTRVNVDGTTTLTGASITNIDANGIDQGNLVLNTKHLILNDIVDIDTFEDTTVGIGTSNGEGIDSKLTSGTYANNSKNKEQITRATIGNGVINTGSTTGPLNRDVIKIQEITKDRESNTEFYVSDNSLALVKNPDEEIVKLKVNLKNIGPRSHAETQDNLPSINEMAEDGTVLHTILDYASFVNIIPTKENDGGYISQIATQFFGDNRAQLSVKDESVLQDLGLNNRIDENGNEISNWDYESYTRRDGTTGYRTNPNRIVTIVEDDANRVHNSNERADGMRIYVSEDDVRAAGINHIFTNGLNNTSNEALNNQQQQQALPDVALLNYNQTHGIVGDLLETGLERVTIALDEVPGVQSIGYLVNGSARQTGSTINQLSSINNGNIHVAAHSQGTQQTYLGLQQNQESIAEELSKNSISVFTLQNSGAPISSVSAQKLVVDGLYGGVNNIKIRDNIDNTDDVFRSQVNPGDPVAMLGGNFGGVNNNSPIYTSEFWGEVGYTMTRGVTSLMGGTTGENPSPHSGYECVIGCGEGGVTPEDVEYYYDTTRQQPRQLTEFYDKIHVDSSHSNMNGSATTTQQTPIQIGIGVDQ